MPTGRPYPAETRIACVAEILAGDTIVAVARRHGVPHATVKGWWAEHRPVDLAQARTRERMVDAIYDTAFDILQGVRATALLLQDEGWARTQEAAGLAVLVSALSDRGIRMLGGLRPPDPGPDRADGGGGGRLALEGEVVDPDVDPPADGPGE